MSPPGILAIRLARGAVGRDGRRQGRMSDIPPPRSSQRRAHSYLTACSESRLAGHGPWQGWGRFFGACCFAGKLRSPAREPGGAAHPALLRGLHPYGIPTRRGGVPLLSRASTSVQVMPLVGPVGRKNRGRLAPLRGSGAAAPGGALRAIDPSARPRSWPAFGPRRLRRQSQPDLAARSVVRMSPSTQRILGR
jgi:hypothetical protein